MFTSTVAKDAHSIRDFDKVLKKRYFFNDEGDLIRPLYIELVGKAKEYKVSKSKVEKKKKTILGPCLVKQGIQLRLSVLKPRFRGT